MRPLAAFVCLLLAALPALAQQKATDPVKLTLPPAPAPLPALRYRLLPEARELTPGNAVQSYYRAFSPEWLTHRRPEVAKVLNAWSENIRAMPPKELEWVKTTSSLKELDRAARRTYCDWEMLPRLREDGISTLLPDVQGFRDYARLLVARARFEAAAREYDKAVETLKTGFALARHISQGGTLIHSLVGMAIAAQMCELIEELMTYPGMPNLYFALTSLPHPFLDLHYGLEGERVMIDSLLPGIREAIRNPKAKPLNVDFLKEKLQPIEREFMGLNKGKEILLLGVMALKVYPEAKKTLMALGFTAEQVAALPMTQVVLMNEVYLYDKTYDEIVKWSTLPYTEGKPWVDLALRQEETIKKENNFGGSLGRLLLPAVARVFEAQVRLERRLAGLRVLEAIRLYAATHKGKLPATLDDIKDVPVPVDPVTGKPFAYKAEGEKFTLTSPVLSGSRVNYEITMKK